MRGRGDERSLLFLFPWFQVVSSVHENEYKRKHHSNESKDGGHILAQFVVGKAMPNDRFGDCYLLASVQVILSAAHTPVIFQGRVALRQAHDCLYRERAGEVDGSPEKQGGCPRVLLRLHNAFHHPRKARLMQCVTACCASIARVGDSQAVEVRRNE